MKLKRGVSGMLATILLIAVAVVSSVMLYFFVTGFFSTASQVRGTVTQVSKVTSLPCSSSSPCYTLSLMIVNPGSTAVSLTYAVISDSSGSRVASSTLTITVSSVQNTLITVSTVSGLSPNEKYTVTLLGVDGVGNSYSSNPAIFTTY